MVAVDLLIPLAICAFLAGAAFGAWIMHEIQRPVVDKYNALFGDCSSWKMRKLKGD